MQRLIFILLLIITPLLNYGQNGGIGTYKFLEMPTSARVSALGGNLISVADGDLNLAYHNPALLDSVCHNHLALNYVSYFAKIKYGYTSYAQHFSNIGTFAAGINYVDYGDFIRSDEFGKKNGTFSAAEYAINLYYSRVLIDSMLHVGITVKPIISNLENYSSYGIATDIGLLYINKKYLLNIAVALKNAGTQIKPYYGDHYEKLPLDLQLGLSKKLAHAPFRISLTAAHLLNWDLTYISKLNTQETENTNNKKEINKFGDKLLRHLTFGLEFIPGKNFYVLLGYNPKIRKEMKIDQKPGFVGFSWGFGVKTSKLRISYGRASYHIAGAANNFTISVNLNEIKHIRVFRHKNNK